MVTLPDLLKKSCQTDAQALDARRINSLLPVLPDWQIVSAAEHASARAAATAIECCFRFKNYAHTIRFVNDVAEVATTHDHHPKMVVDYNRCLVTFTTHSANAGRGGLSLNDFICAAKVQQLFEQGSFVHD